MILKGKLAQTASETALQDVRVAVLIPCYSEAVTIAQMIEGFRATLPDADIYVYDNNSTDGSADLARRAGAIVRDERRQGKAHVVRRMFADIEADVYLMVDGDATYKSAAAPRLVGELLAGPFDYVNGARVRTSREAYRPGHEIGNKLLSEIVAAIFGARSRDVLFGFKAMSRRFAKSFPAMSTGFEIETEILVHALDLDIPMSEIDALYNERPAESVSKLSTFRDGVRILWLISRLIRDMLPLQYFSTIGAMFVIVPVAAGIPVVVTYLETGLVPRLPTALLAVGAMIVGVAAFFTGLILVNVSRGCRETKLLIFLSYPNVRG